MKKTIVVKRKMSRGADIMKTRIITVVLSLFFMTAFTACSQIQMIKKTPQFYTWALRPPMGWNSWDCYGPTVTEEEVKANADYMAGHMKEFGWEYIVVDIRWFVKNTKTHGYNQRDPQYVLDEYGRYLPAENRFPSSAGGKGFKPLADYIHSRGLKFGIHIMRGVPVEAVKKRLPILASGANAADIYSTEMQCRWLRDNYTIVAGKVGSQEYYDSIFELYASWGVDYVKVDDLSVPYHTQEIEMIRKAIDNCGRPIVLSTSPGPTPFENAEHISKHANLWRLTGDFWDNWNSLNNAFSKCSRWHNYIRPGSWPDSDMLALGRIGIRAERGNNRMSRFTSDEEITLMTLWCIVRSPLMFGGDLPSNDEWTLKLITNPAVLAVNKNSENNKPLYEGNLAVWVADVPESRDKYVAVFNRTGKRQRAVNVFLGDIGFKNVKVTDLWTGEDLGVYSERFSPVIKPHGAGLYRLTPTSKKVPVEPLSEPESGSNIAMLACKTVASYVSDWTSADAANDELDAANSRDYSHYGNWPQRGEHWIEYQWRQPVTIDKIDVWWFKDNGIRLPQSYKLQYFNGRQFVDVAGAEGYGLDAGRYNSTTFEPVTTDRLRLVFTSQTDYSTGIIEWRVFTVKN